MAATNLFLEVVVKLVASTDFKKISPTLVVVKLVAATDFDLHVKSFKVIAYLIIIQKLKRYCRLEY